MAKDRNFLIVGVGGQGTILAGDILAEIGMLAGWDSKKSDILGLAVRGGSVASHIRWGDRIGAPMNMFGTVDYLVAAEPLEALRAVPYLKKESTTIYNEYILQPMLVSIGKASYPEKEQLEQTLKEASAKVIAYDATALAEEAGSPKAANVALLGTLSALIDDVDVTIWEEAIRKYVPVKAYDVNIAAFYAGREKG